MRWSLFFFLLVGSLSARAQDWILLNTNDTIYCRIMAVDLDVIHYKTTSAEPVQKMPRDIVRFYHKQRNENKPIRVAIPKEELKAYRKSKENRDKGLRLGLGVGYTYRLGLAPEGSSAEIIEHTRKIKSGFHIKTDIAYFFGRFFGLGFKYTFSNSQAKSEYVEGFHSFGFPYSGPVSDNISLHFIGVHPTARISSKDNSVRFLPGMTIGYIGYLNRSQVGDDFTLKAGIFGLSADIGLEIRLARDLHLGIGVDFALGFITKYQYDDGINEGTLTLRDGNRDNLERLDFSCGLRYYFE